LNGLSVSLNYVWNDDSVAANAAQNNSPYSVYYPGRQVLLGLRATF